MSPKAWSCRFEAAVKERNMECVLTGSEPYEYATYGTKEDMNLLDILGGSRTVVIIEIVY